MKPLLLLVAFLLPTGAGAGEIIGGQEARPHSHPYMAYLQIQTPVGQLSCGGFLVRENFVMTAAHCMGSSIVAVLGAHNIGRQEFSQQRIPVSRIISHPEYDPQDNSNDIMLLKLERRARQNRFVRTLNLPTPRTRLRPGTTCTVAGWGLIGLNRRTQNLQEVQLRVQSDLPCSRRFPFYNSQTQMCVGDSTERKSAFKGDSGGPLVCNNVAQGIVSYGDSVGTPPAVFTKIASFMPWVRRTLRNVDQGQDEHIPASKQSVLILLQPEDGYKGSSVSRKVLLT
ncbi:cathepsin G [Suncus etruscus]|uniref:cathepsin G n=1 Tax=Suncus etruscus TaxID=109475 RepID=UPI00210FC715|nr:cathepsin G [Suncus etruscus]